MTEPVLLFEQQGAIARLTLNRPDSGNSVNLELARALFEAAIRCDQDPAIRCVVLTGSGRLFCAGGDVSLFSSAGERLPALLSELAGTVQLALSRLTRMAKPLLVLVNGPAAGAGFSLALAGDLVLASRSAHFTSAYTAIGITPDCGLTWLLPRLVGLRRAQDIIATNRRVGAEEAEAIGLINRVVDDERLAEEGQSAAARLASSAVGAIGAVRPLLLDSFSRSFETHMELEARAIADAATTAESREGIAAFLERRKADFAGSANG